MPTLRRLLALACLAAMASAQGRWETLAKAPIPPRHGACLHGVGHELVVFGGTDVAGVHAAIRLDGAVLDTSKRQWSVLPDAPLGERAGPIVVPVDGGLYVAGGEDRWRKLHGDGAVLDVARRQWLPVPDWPVAARSQPAVAVDGHLVAVFGGHVTTTARRGDELVAHEEFFADGALVDTQKRSVKAIPKGPLSARSSASLYLHAGRLLVIGGHTRSDRSVVQPRHDAAVYDVASDTWTELDPAPLRGRSDLQFVTHAGKAFIAGREAGHGRKAIAAVWDPLTGAFAAVPGTDALDFRVEATRLFAGTTRVLLWNGGLDLADEGHQALWVTAAGWTPLPLPQAVRPRQAAALAHRGDDVVMFGGNHDVGMVVVDGPKEPAGPPRPAGPEADGLHLDLATGEAAPIPAGPLAPRGRPLTAIAGDRLYVLWGVAGHTLLDDGAAYRLR